MPLFQHVSESAVGNEFGDEAFEVSSGANTDQLRGTGAVTVGHMVRAGWSGSVEGKEEGFTLMRFEFVPKRNVMLNMVMFVMNGRGNRKN